MSGTVNGTLIQISRALSIAAVAVFLAACGGGASKDAPVKAVGYKSALGRALVASHWCSAPSNDALAQFTELDVRQNGQYIKTFYVIKADNSLARRDEERGTWAIVGDQFFTRTMRQSQTRQKVVAAGVTVSSSAQITKQDKAETCLSLSDAGGVVTQSYCSCQVPD